MMIRGLLFLSACGFLNAQAVLPNPPEAPPVDVSPPIDALSPIPDPQNLHERWDSYVQKTFSWKRISSVAAETAFEQTFQLSKCGRPPYCFPHEIGGALTRRTARTTMELAAGALLHEDLRRQPSNLSGFGDRLKYALLHAPLDRGRNGQWQPAYSRFAGTLGAVAVTTAWDGRPLTAGHLGRAFAFTATSYFQDALWTEFEPDIKRMGRRFANHLRRRHP